MFYKDYQQMNKRNIDEIIELQNQISMLTRQCSGSYGCSVDTILLQAINKVNYLANACMNIASKERNKLENGVEYEN